NSQFRRSKFRSFFIKNIETASVASRNGVFNSFQRVEWVDFISNDSPLKRWFIATAMNGCLKARPPRREKEPLDADIGEWVKEPIRLTQVGPGLRQPMN